MLLLLVLLLPEVPLLVLLVTALRVLPLLLLRLAMPGFTAATCINGARSS
jgi:hypothetical protein